MSEKQHNIGLAAKVKRKSLNWSQTYLATKAKTSVSTIGKFEAGLNVNPDVQEEILMVLGMKNSLIAVRDERSILGHRSLSLEELRTVLLTCKDIIREGTHTQKQEFVAYKTLAEAEMLERIRTIFKKG